MSLPRPLSCLLAAALPLTAAAAEPADYAQAKARADRDESSLPAELAERIHRAQAAALDAGVARCATPQADTAPFTVVVELDAQGTVAASWRAGATPLAICMEKFLREYALPAPPQAPLYLSYELTFAR